MGNTPDNSTGSPASSFMARGVRNFLYSGIGTAASFAISFLFAGLTIRYLGLDRAGFFMALSALTGLSGFLGDFGLGTPGVRRVAMLNAQQDLATARLVIGSLTTVNFFSSFVVAVPIVLFFSNVFEWTRLESVYRGDAFWATICTLGTFVLTNTFNSWRGVYSSLERFDLISSLDTLFGFLQGFCGIAVLTLIPTMTAIALTRFILQLARTGADAWAVNRLLSGVPRPGWAWQEIRPMLNFGGWVYLGGVSSLLLSRVSSLILTTFRGSLALPFYEVPQRIYNIVHQAQSSQSRFLFPMLSSYGDQAVAKIRQVEDRLRWLMALGSGLLYMTIASIGPHLLGLIVGSDFADKVKLPLYLACIQGFFQAQDIVPYYNSWALGYGKPNSVISLLQGALVVGTSFILIPKYGFLGASIAQLWVILIVIVHNVWINKIISQSPSLYNWLKSFISPSLMIIAWILVAAIFRKSAAQNFSLILLSTVVGGGIGVIILIFIEAKLFAHEGRWQTLCRLVGYPVKKI